MWPLCLRAYLKNNVPVEPEDNIFGKPTEIKRKPDISSISTSESNKFVKQCKIQLNPSVNDEKEDEFLNSMNWNLTKPLVLL